MTRAPLDSVTVFGLALDKLFLPLKARPFSLFVDVPCRLRNLAVQRYGSGFREATSSARVLAREIGVPMNFP